MDWGDVARQWEAATDSRQEGSLERWQAMFAAGGTYQDPVNPPTADLGEIHRQTSEVMADWHATVGRVAGAGNVGAFEWVGRATLFGTTPITIHGCCVVETDGEGRIVSARDYFDLKEIESQLSG